MSEEEQADARATIIGHRQMAEALRVLASKANRPQQRRYLTRLALVHAQAASCPPARRAPRS